MSRHENTEHTSLENMLNFLFITIIKPIVIKNMPCHAHVHAHVKKAWCHKTMPCHAHVHAHVKKAWCHKKALVPHKNMPCHAYVHVHETVKNMHYC